MGRASRRGGACEVCGNRHPLGNATTSLAETGALLVVTYRGDVGRPRQFVGRYHGVHPDEVVPGEVGHLFEVTSDSILDVMSGRAVRVVGPGGQPCWSVAGVRMLLWPVDLLMVAPEPMPHEARPGLGESGSR
jgi:hypothetical protein